MNLFSIKDIENLSGIKAHTWRTWESRYDLLRPQRTATNIRFYSNEELKKLLNIALLNKHGFKISEIDRMSYEQILEKVTALDEPDAKYDTVINALINNMINLETDHFEKAVNNALQDHGTQVAFTRILFPFFEKIGRLWLTNHINPAQEHLVSNIVRQKLIYAIERLQSPIRATKKGLLFLPAGEFHELGLLFVAWLFRSHGVGVIYAGANLSLKDLEVLINMKKPDFIYTHITMGGKDFYFDKFIKTVALLNSRTPVHISGELCRQYKGQLPPTVFLKKTLADVSKFVASVD